MHPLPLLLRPLVFSSLLPHLQRLQSDILSLEAQEQRLLAILAEQGPSLPLVASPAPEHPLKVQFNNRLFLYRQFPTEGRIESAQAIKLKQALNKHLRQIVLCLAHSNGTLQLLEVQAMNRIVSLSLPKSLSLMGSQHYDSYYFQSMSSQSLVEVDFLHQRDVFNTSLRNVSLEHSPPLANCTVDNLILQGHKLLAIGTPQPSLLLYLNTGKLLLGFPLLSRAVKFTRMYPYAVLATQHQVHFLDLTKDLRQDNFSLKSLPKECFSIEEQIVDIEVDRQSNGLFYLLLANGTVTQLQWTYKGCKLIAQVDSGRAGEGRLFSIQQGLLVAYQGQLLQLNTTAKMALEMVQVRQGARYQVFSLEKEQYLLESDEYQHRLYELLELGSPPQADLFKTFRFPFVIVSILGSVFFQMQRRGSRE